MIKTSLSIVCLLMMAIPSFAQESASASQPPSKQDVLNFMDLMQARARMEQMLIGMKKGMKDGAVAGFKQKIPNPTPEQLHALDSFTEVVFKDFPLDEMVEALVPIYQRHLSKGDLDAVVAFYSSTAGKHFLKEQPAMMAEGMQAGQDIMIKKIPELTDRLNVKIEELAAQESKKNKSPPTANP